MASLRLDLERVTTRIQMLQSERETVVKVLGENSATWNVVNTAISEKRKQARELIKRWKGIDSVAAAHAEKELQDRNVL
jgi:hypothetical protein